MNRDAVRSRDNLPIKSKWPRTPHDQAAFGAHQYGSIGLRKNLVHVVAWKPASRGIAFPLTVASPLNQSATAGADPQRVLTVLKHGKHPALQAGASVNDLPLFLVFGQQSVR